jgi:hypothetical protein
MLRITLPKDSTIDIDESEHTAELVNIRLLLTSLGESLMATIADLQARVSANTSVIASAVTLIQGFKAQLDAAIATGDPVALQALSDSLAASDQALADAVAANTPASAPADPAPADVPADSAAP